MVNTSKSVEPAIEQAEEISFQELFHIFWHQRVLITLLTILGALVGGLTSVIVNATAIRVSTIVEYQWDGINLGEYPNGSRFDVNNAFGPAIYNDVIEQLDVDLTPNEVRNQLTITPIIPDNILALIQSAVEKGETFSYFPSTFRYTLDAAAITLNDNQGKQFLDGLINSFTIEFQQTFVNQIIVRNFAFDDFETYDLLDQVNLINSQLTTMNTSLEAFMLVQPRATTFRSSTLGLSLNDILAQASLVKTLQLNAVEALIVSNQLSRDPSLTVDRLIYNNRILGVDLAKEEQFLEELNLLVENYAGSTTTIIIPGYEGEINTTSALETIYGEIITTQRKIADLEQDILYNESLIQEFESAVFDEELITRAQEELTTVVDNLTTIIEDANTVLTEYNDILNRDITRVLANATTVARSDLTLSTIIGLVLGGLVSLIVAFTLKPKTTKKTKS